MAVRELLQKCLKRGAHVSIAVALFLNGSISCLAEETTPWERLEKQYSVLLIHAKVPFRERFPWGQTDAIAPPAGVVKSYVGNVAIPELRLYPLGIVKAIGMTRIVLCQSLMVDLENPNLGVVSVAGFADLSHGVLYLDVVLENCQPMVDQRRGFHHEVFHLIDNWINGQADTDPEWAGLNRKGFSYGNGGLFVRLDATQGLITTPEKGFLTKYSMASLCEDKAELFSLMVVCPDVVRKQCELDPILAAKTKLVKKRISVAFKDNGAMFWHRAQTRAMSIRVKRLAHFPKVYETIRHMFRASPAKQ